MTTAPKTADGAKATARERAPLRTATPPPPQHRRARRPRVGAGLGRRRPDRGRDRPHRAGDGSAPRLTGPPTRWPARCYGSADGRGRARFEPELRAPERLQSPAGVPAGVRLQGRGDRVRPPGDPIDARRAPGAVRDPPPAPGPPAAASHQADPPRDLRPRSAHLPVLRPPGPRPHARPRRPPPPRRQPHLGEPRGGLPAVQPQEGRQDAGRGAAQAPPPPVRAAERPLLAVLAVPRGHAQRGLAGLSVPRRD